MDTPIIALYYRESDPMKRKMFLDQSIAAGEEEEANAIRKDYGRSVTAVNPKYRIPRQTVIWHCGWHWNLTKMHPADYSVLKAPAGKL